MRTLLKASVRRGIVTAAVMTATALFAQNNNGTSPGSSTTKGAGATALEATATTSAFIQEAAQGNNAEVAMAEVAERKAQNSNVKDLAEMIQKDHTQANDKLKPLASEHGITLEQSLNPMQQKKLQQLEQTPSDQFDKVYVTAMLRDHVADLQKYRTEVRQLQAPDVKTYAENCIPVLRKHLHSAENAARAIGISDSTISSIVHRQEPGMGGTSEQPQSQSGGMSKP